MLIDFISLFSIFNPNDCIQAFLNADGTMVYLLVFCLMAIESSFIPFPSEVVVPPAAYLAYKSGDVNVVMIVVLATLGSLVGALVNYVLSVWIGRPIVYKFANSRFGHMCLINEEKVRKAEEYFDKHGAASTFFGRLIPAVRQLISIPAGLARMPILKFCAFTSLGAMAWNIVLASLGYWLGHMVPEQQLLESVEKYNTYLTYIGLGIGLLCVAFIAWHMFRPQAKAGADK